MDVAWIEFAPVCGACGQRLEYTEVREDIVKNEQGIMYKQYIMRPEKCPRCGRRFCGIRTKEVPK